MTTIDICTRLQSGKKDFHVVAVDKVPEFIKKHPVAFEQIMGPTKPYYDFDKNYETKEEMKAQWRNHYEECMDKLEERYGRKVKILAFDCSGLDTSKTKKGKDASWKVSFHFRLSGAGYYSCGADIPLLEGFDSGVYKTAGARQLFKLPYCHKEGDKRVLKRLVESGDKLLRVEIDHIEQLLGETYADYCVTYLGEEKLQKPTQEKKVEQKQEKPVKLLEKKQETEDWAHLSFEEAKMYVDALSVKRATDRDKWIKVMWALQHLGQNTKLDARALAHSFSKRTTEQNYTVEGVDEIFDAIVVREKPLTFASVIAWAKEDSPLLFVNDFKAPTQNTYYEEVEEFLATNPDEAAVAQWMMGCLALIKDGSDRWFARYRDGWKPVLGGKTPFPFATETSSCTYTMSVKGKQTTQTFRALLGTVKNTMVFKEHCVYKDVQFMPCFKDDEKMPDSCLNRWTGWEWTFMKRTVKDEEVELVLDHLKLMCAEAYPYMLNWLATCVQNPRLKMPLPVFYGIEGCGKSETTKFLRGVFGEDLSLEVTGTNDILGNFNGMSEGKLFTVISEASDNGKSILCNEVFKARIMDVAIVINKKGQSQYKSQNWSKYIITTNHKNAVTVSVNDRRFVPIECSADKVGDRKYFKALQAIHTSDMHGKFFNWLAQRDTGDWSPMDIPETKLRAQLKQNGLHSALQHVRAICEGKRYLKIAPQGYEVWSDQMLYEDYRTWCSESGLKDHTTTKLMNYKQVLIDKLGLVYAQHRKKDQTRVRGFRMQTQELDKAFMKMLKVNESIFEVETDE